MAEIDDKLKELTETKDTTSEFEEEDINQNKAMAVLSYFGILVLLPIFLAKESKYARFHANQGLILFIVYFVAIVACITLSNIPILGILFVIIKYLIYVACLILAILGIINACNGKAKELPLIGRFKILN